MFIFEMYTTNHIREAQDIVALFISAYVIFLYGVIYITIQYVAWYRELRYAR